MKKLSLLMAALCGVFGFGRAFAATVTNLNDAGPGSLRAAIAAGGTVDFAVTGTIVLTSGELVIESPLTINGPGPSALRIQRSTATGTPEFRILHVRANGVTISGVTINNGLVGSTYYNGAGILNEGSLTLNECSIVGNRSTGESSRGTGLHNADGATLIANRCSFIENTGTGYYSEGGGLYVFGNVTVNDSTFRGNSVRDRGAGMHVDYFGSARIERCTFSGNGVEGPNAQGGGIYNYGSLVLINSTLSGNTSSDSGGGIHVDALSRGTTIRSCTISGNNAGNGGGIYANGFNSSVPQVSLKNSIAAGNSAPDIQNSSVITSLGFNLFGTVSGNGISPAAGDQFGLTAAVLKIGPLTSNGGPTQTRALLGGSPAIDHGSEGEFPPIDQRGVARPFGPRIDVGAYELNEILPNQPPVVRISIPADGQSFLPGANINICAAAEDSDGYVATVQFFAGDMSLGIRTNNPVGAGPINPFCLIWSNVPPGDYVLTAKATDDDGAMATSDAVHISVRADNSLPVVTVRTTDPEASEPGIIANTGRFTLTRDGNTNNNLNVYCVFGGTASNGVDYLERGHFVNIPAGVRTANVTITPLADTLVEGVENVVLSLVPPPLDPPTMYAIGSPSNATLYIYDLLYPSTNVPPVVRILTPTNGQMFVAPVNIMVCADARDTNGFVYSVEFFAGDHKIGTRTNCFVCNDPVNPFCILWTNVPPGTHVLRAKATDNQGAMTWSEPVNITVKPADSNQPPVVTIVAPTNNAMFTAPANIFILARVKDPDGFAPAAKVEFFRGDHSLGIGQLIDPGPEHEAVFRLYWTNVPPGNYVLTAKGTDTQGAIAWSGPVNITVKSAETNHPPVVNFYSPPSNHVFYAPADIRLIAYASDAEDRYDLKVEFFAGDHNLGVGTFVPTLCPDPYCPYYTLVWSNVPPGEYNLTAKVTDKAGAMTVSPPVHIVVRDEVILPPLITIEATDAHATESGSAGVIDPGVFTIRRDRATNVPLQVFYSIGGSASNGVDYARISNSVVIPAGSYSTRVVINPLNDNLLELLETVVLRLEDMACIAIYPPPPECYRVGTPREAVVFIEDNDRENIRPKVVITTPHNGSAFTAPADIAIVTDTVDVDGYVPRVEFFVGDRKIGEDSKEFLVAPTNGSHISYEMVWSNVPPGLYSLSAKATDNEGAMGWSEPVRISVVGSNLPPTNLPPIVTVTAIDPLAIEGEKCLWQTNADGTVTRECRTNTAAFLVRRSGPTNSPLTVAYSIRGTASNGVDYLELPGTVTIPSGERSRRIVVTAIDDGLAECSETVILRLLPSEADPRPYVIGWPAKAAAVVLDNDRPAPGTCVLCDGTFHLCVPAANGLTYRLETSIDLVNWLPVYTTTVTENGVLFPDAETGDFPQKFYRVVPEPAAAQDETNEAPSADQW